MVTIYDEIIDSTHFGMEQIRNAERQMIAYYKLIEKPPLTETQFKTSMLKVKQKMSVGISFETAIELRWPKCLTNRYGQATKSGPGFMNTQLRYDGTHVIYRHKYDTEY